MPAGFNVKFDIYRVTHPVDDESGGAVRVDDLLYNDIPGRIRCIEPENLLLQQGIEIDYWYEISLNPDTVSVKEKDVLRVIFPLNAPEINSEFTVRFVKRSGLHPDDSRSLVILKCSKRKFAINA